jgi:hypothetical protein
MSRLGVLTAVATATVALSAQSAALRFDAPKDWKTVPSTSSMRVAQYALARAPGDAEDGELIVYYFGGQGGSVQANLDRWLGQMEQPDGRPTKAVASTSTFAANGLKVTVLDVSGRYVAETAPGATTRHNKPGFRMKAAVIETPVGPYFIKLTGPAKTVERWDASFNAYLKSAKYS